MIRLAHTLGLTVTAESVETACAVRAPAAARLRHRAGLVLRPGGAGAEQIPRLLAGRPGQPPWPRPRRSRSAPGGGVQRGDPAAPAGPGRAGGAARAHGRPVLGAQGRRCVVGAQGRARPRRGPARPRRCASSPRSWARPRRPARRSPLGTVRQPSGKRLTVFALAGDLDADAIVSNTFAARVAARFGAHAGVPRDRPRGLVRAATRPGARSSAASCRSWTGSTPCSPAGRPRPGLTGRGAGYARP